MPQIPVLSSGAITVARLGKSTKQGSEFFGLTQHAHSVTDDCHPRVIDLTWGTQTQVTPRARHMVKLSETGDDTGRKIYDFHQPGLVDSRTVPVHR